MDHEKWLEQHDQMIADHEMRRERDMAEIRAIQAKTDKRLDRAIRLAVQDARRQRTRNAGFQASVERLNNALAAFMERSGNGQH